MKNLINAITVLSFSIFLASCSSGDKPEANGEKVVKQTQKQDKVGLGVFPDVELTTLMGEKLSMKNLRGKVVFVNFWATWCAPCRQEIPDFISFQEKYGDGDFTILGISLDEEGFEVVKPYAQEMGINYPLAVDDQNLSDKLGGIFAVPTTYFVDKKGNITGRKIGYFSKDQMKKQIDSMLD